MPELKNYGNRLLLRSAHGPMSASERKHLRHRWSMFHILDRLRTFTRSGRHMQRERLKNQGVLVSGQLSRRYAQGPQHEARAALRL